MKPHSTAFLIGSWAILLMDAAPGQSIRLRSPAGNQARDQVEAQAKLIEAQVTRAKNYAEAKQRYDQATAKFIDNASDESKAGLGELRALWESREMANRFKWEKMTWRLENNRKPMIEERARKLAVWVRTVKGDNDRNWNAVRSGKLLNRVALQIDETTGISEADAVSSSFSSFLTPFDETALRSINLSVSSINGPVMASLSSSVPEAFRRWPFVFRDPALRSHAYAVNQAAAELFQPATSEVRKYEVEKEAMKAFEAAADAFYHRFPLSERKSATLIDSQRQNAAERFLQELERTIRTAAETPSGGADGRLSYFETYEPANRNAATMVQYMMKYGLRFTPASAGGEAVYGQLFEQFLLLADQLNAAPTEESIEEAMINLNFADIIDDETPDPRVLK